MDDALGNGCHRAQGLGDSVVLVVHNTYFYPIRMAVRVFVSVLSALAPRGKQVSVLNFKRGDLWLFLNPFSLANSLPLHRLTPLEQRDLLDQGNTDMPFFQGHALFSLERNTIIIFYSET